MNEKNAIVEFTTMSPAEIITNKAISPINVTEVAITPMTRLLTPVVIAYKFSCEEFFFTVVKFDANSFAFNSEEISAPMPLKKYKVFLVK